MQDVVRRSKVTDRCTPPLTSSTVREREREEEREGGGREGEGESSVLLDPSSFLGGMCTWGL